MGIELFQVGALTFGHSSSLSQGLACNRTCGKACTGNGRRLASTVSTDSVQNSTARLAYDSQMPSPFKLLLLAAIAGWSLPLIWAQDLAPRAYVITPVHSNAVTATYSLYDGSILLNGTLPITNASGLVNVGDIAVYHALNFFGRSANFTASLPYGIGNFQGTIMKNQTSVYRSGLLDSTYRFSVNLMGGPAMDTREFSQWKQKTLLGVSLKVIAPTGQYYPTKLVNYGGNRWAFKPELGLSQR